MAIRKQEFYEGAALHQLARNGRGIGSLKYQEPFFLINDDLLVYLKYSTRGRSPWPFTFMPEEQVLLEEQSSTGKLVIGLICGGDGIAAVTYEAYRLIAAPRGSALHVSCYRQFGKHYSISGPDGELNRKIAPSLWQRLLERGSHETS